MVEITLRDITREDLPIFFNQQLNQEANFMAAFISRDPSDRDAFMSHWTTILSDDTAKMKTIIFHEQVAGYIGRYIDKESSRPEITYWIGREFWGKGIATRALSEFLSKEEKKRPIYARAARDNTASIRVLEKCGFAIFGKEKSYANARNREIEEVIMKLEYPIH